MKLSDRQVEILKRRYLAEETYDVIANALEMQPGAVLIEETEALKILIRRYVAVLDAAEGVGT